MCSLFDFTKKLILRKLFLLNQIMNLFKHYCRFLLLSISCHTSSAFIPCQQHPLSFQVKRICSSNLRQYIASMRKATELESEVETEETINSSESKDDGSASQVETSVNLSHDTSTDKKTHLKFKDDYSKANTELKMTWGW